MDNKDLLGNNGLPLLVPPLQVKNYIPGVRDGGLRREIFDSETNGLARSGAIIRRGRKLLIDLHRYVAWLREGGKVTE